VGPKHFCTPLTCAALLYTIAGEEVWSKKTTGNLPPSLDYLYEAIDNILASSTGKIMASE
jgi:hypothetical protein